MTLQINSATTYDEIFAECMQILWTEARAQYADDRAWSLNKLYRLERDVADRLPAFESRLLKELYPHLLAYRKTNERGFRWLSMLDSLLWRHIATANDEQEFNSMVDDFFAIRRSNEIQYPKQSKYKEVSEDDKNGIVFSLLEKFHGPSVAAAWAVTGSDESKVIVTDNPAYWNAKSECIKNAHYVPLPRMPMTKTHWRYEICRRIHLMYIRNSGVFLRAPRFSEMENELHRERDQETDEWRTANLEVK